MGRPNPACHDIMLTRYPALIPTTKRSWTKTERLTCLPSGSGGETLGQGYGGRHPADRAFHLRYRGIEGSLGYIYVSREHDTGGFGLRIV